MINSEIRQFRDSIVTLINVSSLPIEIKRLVFEEIRGAVNDEAEKMLLIEHDEAQKKDCEKTEKQENSDTQEEKENE